MHIKAPKDFWAGLMFMAFGIGFAVVARNYDMGVASNMKAAYFPTVLGILLALLGSVLLIRSLAIAGEAVPKIYLKPATVLLVSVVVFGILLRPMGLVTATIALVIVSTLAGSEFRIKRTLILAFGLAAFSVAVFHYGLGLPFKLLPWE